MIRKLLLLVQSLFFNSISESKQILQIEIKRKKPIILTFCFLLFTLFYSNVQLFAQSGTVTSNNTGVWSSSATWGAININRTANISSSNTSTTVTGTGTLFLTELTVGSVITRQNGTAIGTVASITNNTTLILTANATNTVTNQSYRTISGPPSPVDTVIIGNNHTVTVNGTYTCAALTIGTSNFNMATLDFLNSGNQLTINGAFTLGGNNASRPGTLDMTNGGTLIANSIGLGNNTAANVFTAGSGTVQLAANDVLPATIFTTFNNLSVNAGTTTMGVGLTINGNLNIANGATLTSTTNNYGLTLRGNFTNNGTFTANASLITLAGTSNQNIAGFTTTGNVTMAKTGGTATFAGSVSGNALTINGNNGTLNLGTRLSHTFTSVALTNGTLNGGSSTINLSGGTPFSGTGATFTPATGTVNLNAAGNQTTVRSNFYNLTLSGSGAKTFSAITTIDNLLTISGTAKATLGSFGTTHTAKGLLTVGATRLSGVYGGANSTAPAANRLTDYFNPTATSIVTITYDSCTSFAGVAPITKVTLNSLNSPTSETSTAAYEPITTATTTLNKGDYYSLVVKGNTSGDVNIYYTAFFDWNGDGDFADAGEGPIQIGTIRNSSGLDEKATSVYFQVPPGATGTSIKMRIIGLLGAPNSTPCTVNTGTGQVEDYTITLQSGCAVALPPSVSTLSTASTVCPDVPFTLSLGDTFGDGATFAWETSSSLTGPWTSAATPTVAFFNSTFSTNQASGTTVGNMAVYGGTDTEIKDGVLVLTDIALDGHNGGFLINKANTANITPFTATFKYRIQDGGTVGADGMSLSYGGGFAPDAGGGEGGEGAGLRIQFDTYDNEDVAQGSRVRIIYNNTSIFNTAINAPFNLRTATYKDVNLYVDTDGYLTLAIQNPGGTMETVVSKLLLPGYAAADKSTWKFKFSARTGGSKDKHSIDDLTITFLDSANSKAKFTTSQTAKTYYRAKVTCSTSSVTSTPVFVDMTSAVITTQPTAPLAVCSANGVQTITVAATGSGLTYSWRLAGTPVVNGGVISGQGTNTLTLTNPIASNAGNYDVVVNGACSSTVTSNVVAVVVNPNSTVTRTSDAATTNQSTCINTAITNITYTTTNATGATFTGLPTGVTGSWAANVITISGIPSGAAGPYNYTVNLTGCGNVTATGTITVNPNNTVALTSDAATTNQSTCINTAITNITYTTTNATGATFTGLPTGVTGSWAANAITISGIPTGATGPYNYTVNLTGCGNVTATGTITVNPNSTVTRTSDAATTNQSTCINTAITNITYTTTNATGATFTGLPTGVTGSWAANVITISGIPSGATGPYNYTVHLTGCGNVTATGTITVNPNNTVALTSDAATTNQSICINTAITNITYTTTYATGATFTGLPTGVTGSWAANAITISGIPTGATGPYNYTINLTGCGNVTATGTITVNPNSTVTRTSAAATTNQSTCINTAITNITYTTTNATGATFTGLPTGVTGSWAANVITISGIPTGATGPYNYTVHLTGCGNVTTTGTITIDTLPVITTQPQPLVICEGQNGSFTVVTSATSPTYQWQYSTNISGPWIATNAAAGVSGHTTATLSITNVPLNYSGNFVRCFVTSNTCSITSNAVLLTVNPLPTVTVGTPTDVTCTTLGSVTLTNLPAGNWTLNQTGFASNTINNSGTIYTVTGLAAGTYRFTVNNGTCTSLVSSDAVITDQSSTTWDGSSWSKGIPDATKSAIINGAFTVSADLTACSLTINPGIAITVPSARTLNIVNGLTVLPSASLTFENHSSLVQVDNNGINSGKITYKRISPKIRQADFTYWSTPVSPQKLVDVSPLTLGDKYFGYNGNNWVVTNKNNNMVVGKGYIIRGPQTYSPTLPADYTASFIGVPNNGIITGETMAAGKYYLIGNPYPSALFADKLLDDNLFLGGTLYFWTHNTAVVLTGAYQYSSTDYASYNKTGGVGTGAISGSIPGANNTPPSGYIAAGQSFFASAESAGTVTFNNGMRRGAFYNSQFFKSAQSDQKHRVWLNMTNAGGAFKQMLVGYVEGASNEYEKRYDGVSFDANPYLDFYSVANGNHYVIQGRALPFEDTDLVPLGYRTTIAGAFTISLDLADGDLASQNIYIEDKKTNVIHDLRTADYTFTTEKGTFADRFVLRYSNKTLGTGDFENVENGLLVSVKEKTIKVTSSKENIKEVTIFDVTGKLLYNKKKVGTAELQIQNLQSANQVLLVKVTLENDFTATKKIIFN